MPSLNVLPESYARVVGSVHGYGFPIVTSPADAVCGEKWEIRVTKNEVIQSNSSVFYLRFACSLAVCGG